MMKNKYINEQLEILYQINTSMKKNGTVQSIVKIMEYVLVRKN